MGKHKYFETPQKLWDMFEEYQKHIKQNPIRVQDYVGKDGDMVYRDRERPLTIEGFQNYCRKKVGCVHDYFANTNNAYDDYSSICRAIKDEIRQDQIEGGMVNIYNPSITQRLNGLTEKQDVTTNGQSISSIQVEIIKNAD
jgi:hypothetical protein